MGTPQDLYATLINDREKFIDWRPNYTLIKFLIEQAHRARPLFVALLFFSPPCA